MTPVQHLTNNMSTICISFITYFELDKFLILTLSLTQTFKIPKGSKFEMHLHQESAVHMFFILGVCR